MKLMNVVMAGATALALSGAAFAGHAIGWYVGLGTGWNELHGLYNEYYVGSTLDYAYRDTYGQSVPVAGMIGYRFGTNIRVENELGYDTPHSLHFKYSSPHGYASAIIDTVNVLYDYPLTDRWNLTAGVGIGYGWAIAKSFYPTTSDYLLKGTAGGFAWQLIVGTSWSVTDCLDIGLDYRYRELAPGGKVDASLVTISSDIDGAKIGAMHEGSVLLTARFYLGAE